MKPRLTLITLFLLFFSLNSFSSKEGYIRTSIYRELQGLEKPALDLFERAYLGYIDLKLNGQVRNGKDILILVDFRLHSTKKRFWLIDLKSKTILHHTYVSHGENSGDDYALEFSNQVDSHKSSLGFYITQETYIGRNGLSLRLQGIEHGFNTNARERYVVLHGADYATPEYIKENGKLGHSEGCPAVPMGEHKKIIELAKDGNVLFIYFPDSEYLEKSNYMMDY